MNELIKEEWDFYFKGAAFKSKYTIASYKNNHRRLTDYLDSPIIEATSKEVIQAVNELANNPNTRASLLNTAIIFFGLYELNVDDLQKEAVKIKSDIINHRNLKAADKVKDLPSVDELNKQLKALYVAEKWADFIILWLMINYNTRNQDVDVEVVTSIHKTKSDKTRNYIVKRKEDFVFIRNNYKTSSTYGPKRHIFKSELIKRAMRYWEAQQPPGEPLHLINNKGEPLAEGSIANHIKKITGGLTESDINKIQVTAIEAIADYDKLLKMSERRGTDPNTLITQYNLKFQTKDLK